MTARRLADRLRFRRGGVPRLLQAQFLVPPAAQMLFWLLPRGRHVVVHGFPVFEANAVETVRALLARFRGRVVWLDGPDDSQREAMQLGDAPRLRVVGMNTPLGLLAFLTARASFFTHGLYWSVRPPKRKPLVDLWHGDGPKAHSGAAIASTLEVSGSGIFGRYRAEFHNVPAQDLLLTGNPRTAQLRRPASSEQLGELGLQHGRPFVVAMPTFRRSLPVDGDQVWRDFVDHDPSEMLRERLQALVSAFARSDVQVVIKRHPLDAETGAPGSAIVVTDAQLDAAGTAIYPLLAASSGLITDYSSVWTDYLMLDRPIAFVVPDLGQYRQARGLRPDDVMDHLPGRVLDSDRDVDDFVQEVVGGHPSSSQSRRAAIERFELVHPESPADDLLDLLETRGVLPSLSAVRRGDVGATRHP